MKFIELGGFGIFKSELLESKNIQHAFTTKLLPGNQTSFTSDPYQMDESALGDLLTELDLEDHKTVFQKQVHGDQITVVKNENLADKISVIPANDGLITNDPKISLVSLSADCMSLILAHPESGAIGNAHCGRMGALKNLPAKLVYAMCREYIILPHEIIAVMGTSISAMCYEVGDDVVDEIKNLDPTALGYLLKHDSRRYFDLRSYVYSQLLSVGIMPENIDSQSICSHCNDELFFSYRRDGSIEGRMAAIISTDLISIENNDS